MSEVNQDNKAIKTGKCGNNVLWKIEDRVLTIYGTGDMWEDTPLYRHSWEDSFRNSCFYPYKKKVSSVKEIIVGTQVTSIKAAAFQNFENLETITILGSATTIEHMWFFKRCSHLLSINVSKENIHYSSQDGVLFQGDALIRFPCGKGGNYTVPKGIRRIGASAFSRCGTLKSVVVPEGVEIIEDGAFECCWHLESTNIPDSIRTIGEGIFSACLNLAKVEFPDSIANTNKSINLRPRGFVSEESTYKPDWATISAFHVVWEPVIPEIGKTVYFTARPPFYVKTDDCFSLVHNKRDFVTVKLRKYWQPDKELIIACADVVDMGDIFSFVKRLTEEEIFELEKTHRYDIDSHFDKMTRKRNHLFTLAWNDEEGGECIDIFTDKDGVDHLIFAEGLGYAYFPAAFGDHIIGLHKYCPYYPKPDRLMDLSGWTTEDLEDVITDDIGPYYSFSTGVRREPFWKGKGKRKR